MTMSLKQRAEIERIKSEIANKYGVVDFEDVDRGNITSRDNGNIIRTLVELAEETLD